MGMQPEAFILEYTEPTAIWLYPSHYLLPDSSH